MRLLAADMRAGFWSNRYKYLLLCACLLALSLQFLADYRGALGPLAPQQPFSAGDVFFSYFLGSPPPLPSSNPLASFPIGWFAFQVIVAAIVGYYPVRSGSYDAQLFLRARSRLRAGLSRFAWAVLAVGLCYALALAASLMTALAAGRADLFLSPSLLESLYHVDASALEGASGALLLCMPPAASLAVSAAQLLVARVAGPVAGLMAVAAFDVASVFVYSLFFLSGAAMLGRSAGSFGPHPARAAVFALSLACFFLCAALFLALGRKSNLLNPEESEQ